jgi:hypothetical protein
VSRNCKKMVRVNNSDANSETQTLHEGKMPPSVSLPNGISKSDNITLIQKKGNAPYQLFLHSVYYIISPIFALILLPITGIASLTISCFFNRKPYFNPKDKVILITGASSGIGESLAYHYAQKGSILVLCARRKDALSKVASSCSSLGSAQVLTFVLDVSDSDETTKSEALL